MGLGKQAARALLDVIEEYADARAQRYCQDDQGHNDAAIEAARAKEDVKRKALLSALGLWEESHVTRTNPSGEVRQCAGRHLHTAHEWQAEFGGYFNVYCPGNDGKTP